MKNVVFNHCKPCVLEKKFSWVDRYFDKLENIIKLLKFYKKKKKW